MTGRSLLQNWFNPVAQMTSPGSSAMDPAFLAFFVVPRWPPFPPGSHPLPPATSAESKELLPSVESSNSAGCVLYLPQWGHVLPGGCSVWLGVEYADAGSLGHVHPDVAGGSALSETHGGRPGCWSQMQGWGQGGSSHRAHETSRCPG